MTTKKKIVLSIAILLVLIIAYGYDKAKRMAAIFEKMSISPSGISNIDLGFSRIKFAINVILTNPTADSLQISGMGIANLKKLKIFYKNKQIATSNVVMTDIEIPNNNSLEIKNIPVEVTGDFLLNNVTFIYDMVTKFDVNQISTVGVIDVAGYEIEV